MGNGEREQGCGGALTNSSLFQLPLLRQRLLPVSLVQVSPRVHPERQRLLFPRGTRQHLRGRHRAAGCLSDIIPAHSDVGRQPSAVVIRRRALMLTTAVYVYMSAVEHSCPIFTTFSLPTSTAKAKLLSMDVSPLQFHATDRRDTNAVPLRLIPVDGFSLVSPC